MEFQGEEAARAATKSSQNESISKRFYHRKQQTSRERMQSLIFAGHWQVSKKDVRTRNAFMFNNPLMSDVRLISGKGPDQTEIPVHKYVLAISSPVFYAMFYGSLSNTDCKEVNIEDSDTDSLLEMLRYFYCDETQLTTENVFGTLYLAKKYVVPSLEDLCVVFLEQNLDADNALDIVPQAILLNEEQLQERCLDIIDCRTTQVLDSCSFTDISRDLLKSVLGRDTLWAEEIDIFKAVLRWAEKECQRCDLECTPGNLRSVVGDCLNLIRFPTMTDREFADHVARSGLLSAEEALNVFLYFTSTNKPVLKFPTISRIGPAMHHVRRFPAAEDGMRFGYYGTEEGIKFQTDRDISIDGLGLYGAVEGNSEGRYEIITQIIRDNQILKHMRYTSTSASEENIYKIMFDEPVPVMRCVWHSVVVRLQGPRSWKGIEGFKIVLCHGVTFQFGDYTVNSITSESQGQIPDIIFRLI
ncbi:BTB/POZ domain-containing protein 6-like [Rhopilema esculentum]|uniref:BTB/POZ domain-containing protein 6-like n=1 Tax=Rhopilema esculentum TaxID=499914 RepID=UPI0031CE7874|eukprot:gene7240-12921_t